MPIAMRPQALHHRHGLTGVTGRNARDMNTSETGLVDSFLEEYHYEAATGALAQLRSRKITPKP